MTNEEIKKLCSDIMKADTEEAVISILKQYQYWDNPECWRLYGDDESNYSAAGNQADIGAAALVEKITNSRDAILMNQCYLMTLNHCLKQMTLPNPFYYIRERVRNLNPSLLL